MKSVLIFTLFLSYLLAANLFAAQKDDNVVIMTEVYPPYNMKVDGKLAGISVDVLESMLGHMGSTKDRSHFVLTNWSRAYSLAEKRQNHMVFSTTRTAQRESIFKWVGPITKTTIGIIAPKNKKIILKTLSDINHYRVGTVLKDIGEQLLLEAGFDKSKLHSISGENAIELSFKKMKNNRIDMFAYEINAAKYEAKSKGFNLDDYQVIYTLKEGELFYAFNKSTDDQIINKWQKALDDLKADGTLKKILKKYRE
ncbi:MAG: ABC transporter substrate-binding protein [Pseudomonadota bacterium]